LAGIDDALPPEAHAWAARRGIPTLLSGIPTLLISIDPAEGLTRPVIERSLRPTDNQPTE
jgi:hypothetical protein